MPRPKPIELPAATIAVETNTRVVRRLEALAGYGIFGGNAGQVAERLICDRLEEIEREGEWLTGQELDWDEAGDG